MYTEKDSIREFLAGDYSSESQLTLGREDLARQHEANGDLDLAAIHRLPVDDARSIFIVMLGRCPAKLRESWRAIRSDELPE